MCLCLLFPISNTSRYGVPRGSFFVFSLLILCFSFLHHLPLLAAQLELALFVLSRDAAIRAVRLLIFQRRAAEKRDAAAASLFSTASGASSEAEDIEDAIALSLAGTSAPAPPATPLRAQLSTEQQRAVIFDECILQYIAAMERCRAHRLCVCCTVHVSRCRLCTIFVLLTFRANPSHHLTRSP